MFSISIISTFVYKVIKIVQNTIVSRWCWPCCPWRSLHPSVSSCDSVKSTTNGEKKTINWLVVWNNFSYCPSFLKWCVVCRIWQEIHLKHWFMVPILFGIIFSQKMATICSNGFKLLYQSVNLAHDIVTITFENCFLFRENSILGLQLRAIISSPRNRGNHEFAYMSRCPNWKLLGGLKQWFLCSSLFGDDIEIDYTVILLKWLNKPPIRKA